jgi:hypothetical protein
MIERLRSQVGRLDITPEELEGRKQRSALFTTMFLAFRMAGAKDWRSSLQISLDHKGVQDKLQFHHFFPKALLRAAGRTSREADDIANLTFISGKTNRQISDKSPAEYLAKFLAGAQEDAFAAQCIPIEARLLEVAAYPEFLKERRRQIAARLNEFLDHGS